MVEKLSYEIIKKIDSIEIRKYPKHLRAIVKGQDDTTAFNALFQYISGNNNTQSKIKMTAPVINSEKIDMTTPVLSKENYMAFILPSSYDSKSIPLPANPLIAISEIKEKIMAVLRFGGYATMSKISSKQKILFDLLEQNKIDIIGEPILMRYNSPFAPSFIRRNEIGVEIKND